MKKKILFTALFSAILLIGVIAGLGLYTSDFKEVQIVEDKYVGTLISNSEYGFSFVVPSSWSVLDKDSIEPGKNMPKFTDHSAKSNLYFMSSNGGGREGAITVVPGTEKIKETDDINTIVNNPNFYDSALVGLENAFPSKSGYTVVINEISPNLQRSSFSIDATILKGGQTYLYKNTNMFGLNNSVSIILVSKKTNDANRETEVGPDAALRKLDFYAAISPEEAYQSVVGSFKYYPNFSLTK